MTAKLFEIRDVGTFIPALAIRLDPSCEADRYLLARAGFGREPDDQAGYVMLTTLSGGSGSAQCDPYEWGGGNRTMHYAHKHICENFDSLDSGSVVDVQFILGETATPKQSESKSGY